ncbi:MAG: GTP 3',8-cyclase MoaA [Candidatus Anammoximicrobium sp.]|nr:GTP 3',8-cyclase MoaA [Candidatus Anammoximicrobium sp.]
MTITERLVDSFGRVHTNLRICVTDRCNIRCFYCMPYEGVRFKPRRELLTFEEIERFVRVAARLGVTKLRITGGEPLVRSELPRLIAKLAAVPGIEDLAMTTNGMLLTQQAAALQQAGLQRLNISLDAMREETFERIARRRGLDQVLAGLAAARRQGFCRIRLNTVAIRGLTEEEIVPLATFALQHDLELRFIEFMPLDGERGWQKDLVLPGDEIRAHLEAEFGRLTPAERPDPSQPAVDYRLSNGGRIGLINPVSQPFCSDCNRLRITAEGQVRNCLFSTVEWDARAILRGGGSDDDVAALVRACVGAKKPGHGIDEPGFLRPQRAMFQIGG